MLSLVVGITGNMSFSSLPPELIRSIVHLALPTSAPTPTSSALRFRLSTLSALSLVSPTLHAIATEHLYAHLLLPTEASARLLLRTFASDRWTAGEMAGRAGTIVRSVEFGKSVERGREVEGGWVGEVLGVVGGKQLGEVAFVGLGIDGDAFKGLKAITHLSLTSTELIIDDDSAIVLPSVTHLSLHNTRISDKVFGDYSSLLSPLILPRLSHLSSSVSASAHDPSPTHATTAAAFAAVAPQLVSLALDEHLPWLGTDEPALWQSMASLRSLALVEPISAPGSSWIIACALEHLPAPLHTLDLCARDAAKFVLAAGAVMNEWIVDRPSSRELKVLRLPLVGAFGLGEGEEDVALWEDVVLSLEAVSELGLEKGARVEWMDWEEGEGEGWVTHVSQSEDEHWIAQVQSLRLDSS